MASIVMQNYLIFIVLDWYAFDLIIMKMALVADSVAPSPFVLSR